MIDKRITQETIRLIFELASTLILKSLVNIGYMEEMYKEEDFDKLVDAQEKICEQLLSELFGKEKSIPKSTWKERVEGYSLLT